MLNLFAHIEETKRLCDGLVNLLNQSSPSSSSFISVAQNGVTNYRQVGLHIYITETIAVFTAIFHLAAI